jgi:hypothetical protein
LGDLVLSCQEKRMSGQRSWKQLAGAIIVFALAVPIVSSSSVLAADCKAFLDTELRKKQEDEGSTHMVWVWKVDVETPEVCADVDFQLIVRERTKDGEEVEKTQRLQVKASSREVKSRKVNHVMMKGTAVLDWKFEVTGCKPCG